jgi:hypothetical protein
MLMSSNTVKLRLLALSLAAPLLAAACLAQASPSAPTMTTTGSTASASEVVSAPPSESHGISGQCADRSWPPYRGPSPVIGISVRAIDKGHLEITNATSRTYYYRVSRWVTMQLDCGRGVTEQEAVRGPIAAGETIEIGGGSTPDVPATVGIWDRPCGEACSAPPIGLIVVPVSSVEPVPQLT